MNSVSSNAKRRRLAISSSLTALSTLVAAQSSARADDSVGWTFGTALNSSTVSTANANLVNNSTTATQSALSVGPAFIGNTNGTVSPAITNTAFGNFNANMTPGGTASDGKTYAPLGPSQGNNIGNAVPKGATLVTGDTAGASAYLAFNVTPRQAVTFTGFNFASRSTVATGPTKYALYYSVGTSTTEIGAGTGTLPGTAAAEVIDGFSLPAAAGTTVNFRLYGYGYNGPNTPAIDTENWETDDWQLTYTVAAVPEPTSLLLVGVAAVPLAIGRRRQRRAAAC